MAKPASKVKADAYRNYINGEWLAPSSDDYIENRNPADSRDLVGRFPASTAEDTDAAVQAAAEAFPKWRRLPAPRRAEILFRAGHLLLQRKDEFARAMTREMGKVLKEARGDVQEGIDTAWLHGGEGRRLHGFSAPSELPNKAGWTVRAPIGVAGLVLTDGRLDLSPRDVRLEGQWVGWLGQGGLPLESTLARAGAGRKTFGGKKVTSDE